MSRNSYIIAVTGGRDYFKLDVIARALREQIDYAHREGLRAVLLVGGCPTGADEIARKWWHRAERPYVVDPATFAKHGRSAGPSRNNRMAVGSTFAMDPPFHADVLLVFPGGRGTADCRSKFEAMGTRIVDIGVGSGTQ